MSKKQRRKVKIEIVFTTVQRCMLITDSSVWFFVYSFEYTPAQNAVLILVLFLSFANYLVVCSTDYQSFSHCCFLSPNIASLHKEENYEKRQQNLF